MATRTKCMKLMPGDVVVLHRTLRPASLSNAEVRYTTYGDLGVVESSEPVYAVASSRIVKYWHKVIVGAQNQWVPCETNELEVIDHDESLLNAEVDLVAIDISGFMVAEELDVELKKYDDLIQKAGRVALFTDKIEANWEGHQHGSNCTAQELLDMGCRGATDIQCVLDFAKLNAFKKIVVITNEQWVIPDAVRNEHPDVTLKFINTLPQENRTEKLGMTREFAKSLGLNTSDAGHPNEYDISCYIYKDDNLQKRVLAYPHARCKKGADPADVIPKLVASAYQEGVTAGEKKTHDEIQKAGSTIRKALFGDNKRNMSESFHPFPYPMW